MDEDKYTTIEVNLDDEVIAIIDEAAACAGVTRDQAASVITFFALRRYMEETSGAEHG